MVGHTRLFLKYYHADEMEAALRKYYSRVIAVQTAIRALLARRQLLRLQERARMSAAERAAAELRYAPPRASLTPQRCRGARAPGGPAARARG